MGLHGAGVCTEVREVVAGARPAGRAGTWQGRVSLTAMQNLLHLMGRLLFEAEKYDFAAANFAVAGDAEALVVASLRAAQERAEPLNDIWAARLSLLALCAVGCGGGAHWRCDGRQEDFRCARRAWSIAQARAGHPNTALVRFVEMTFEVLQRDAAPVYQVLLEKYNPSLKRCPRLLSLAQNIGAVYFDIKARGEGLGGLIQSMMGMMG